jgi:type VI secretion system protein ImpF
VNGGRRGIERDESLVPSILDRLLDDRPDLSADPEAMRRQDVRDLERVVARDLEALLNARREALDDLRPDFTELKGSLLVYGLPDFTSLSLAAGRDRTRIQRAIEEAIATFEPRLDRVRVTLQEPREHEPGLHFHVQALLRAQPAPLPVRFDAELQTNTQQYVVRQQD